MTIKTVLACLTDEQGADSLMKAAAALARRHTAHLIGLHTLEALMVYPAIAMHVPQDVYRTYGESQLKKADALKAIFDRHTHAEDFVAEWRLLKSQTQTAAERIVESGRCADVVMMSSAAADSDHGAQMFLVEQVIRDAGRPVIVVPQGFDGTTLGQSILIGWNATRESARAAHDALTLMREGDMAHILRVDDTEYDAMRDATSTDLAAAFARYGIETTLIHVTWEDPSVADTLNRTAFEKGADMISVGAFGHSRAYALVIGAATRKLLEHIDMPVMFSR
ncbi:universal stress protein [Maribius pontilimi]|uniref:Universal stress protein n=1 Tax=Palleronia pontilimi TaxID=1964209 RepID=A0A934IJH9_9RHOB|nr:universal stress protein [Palleronia pontilimi]MBJ3763700.1 universal stress protein [Palleronia pontilimi]